MKHENILKQNAFSLSLIYIGAYNHHFYGVILEKVLISRVYIRDRLDVFVC